MENNILTLWFSLSTIAPLLFASLAFFMVITELFKNDIALFTGLIVNGVCVGMVSLGLWEEAIILALIEKSVLVIWALNRERRGG